MREYGPEGFWWERMLREGHRPSPGYEPPAPVLYEGPRAIAPTKAEGVILCMRHRMRANLCGCLAGGY